MDQPNNYVVGRGKLYFNRFADGTMAGPGFKYFGNTPDLTVTQSATSLDHYSSDEGMKFKDASVDLQSDSSGTFTCDNISVDNLALFFLGIVDLQAIADSNAIKAGGAITLTGVGTAADTVTINGQAVTFEASGAAGFQINIGASATATAQNLKTLINNNPSVFGVTATGGAAVLTLTAIEGGTTGNAITLAKSSTAVTLSGATLTGGTDTGSETLTNVTKGLYYPLGVTDENPNGVRNITVTSVQKDAVDLEEASYSIDTVTGLFHVDPDAGDVDDGDDIVITYSVNAGERSLVIGSNNTIYGNLRFYSKNPVGRQKDYNWPYVKLSPNGDMNLKGDTWQQTGFKFDVLQTGLSAAGRVYIDDHA